MGHPAPCGIRSKRERVKSVEVAGVEISTGHFINGERVYSAQTLRNTSPIDGQFLGDFASGGVKEVELAVQAARDAFPAWRDLGPKGRGEILERLASLIEENVETLAQVETLDNGALLRSHRKGVMPRAAANIRFFAEWAINDLKHVPFETRGHTNNVSWDPSGVAALITPWNAPLMLATWKIGPALAAGDTVVLKPAEWTPLTASLFADLTVQAGLPRGVFNVVFGLGEEAGAALTKHPGISRISFTGSVPTAKIIARAAADNLTPITFELGGKSPLIVLDDADLDLAATLAVESINGSLKSSPSDSSRRLLRSSKVILVSRRLKWVRRSTPITSLESQDSSSVPERMARRSSLVARRMRILAVSTIDRHW
jgi:aminomuconate-semialdehyde/2-hydroxymuconate-6-semialdehyde dehydrogenase